MERRFIFLLNQLKCIFSGPLLGLNTEKIFRELEEMKITIWLFFVNVAFFYVMKEKGEI